ncbi:4267_t:CDS:2, partial [Entrophospora sp. SA101]
MAIDNKITKRPAIGELRRFALNKFNSINIGGGSKLQEIPSPQLPKSPSTPISQDSKETKDEPNNGIINENKAIIDKPKDNCGSGKVYKATYNSSSTFALKSYKCDITNMKEIINELKLLHKVDYHQNIIHFYGVTKNEGNKKYLLVLEYADSGTLRSYLQKKSKSINWDLMLKFAYEIASAVSCLHENNIIHRNLHSNNFLVHQKTIKLVDFGLSRKILESTATSAFYLAGMLPYVDPQCFKYGNKQVYKQSKKSDVYSVGVLLWELTSDHPPFSNLDPDYQKYGLIVDISGGIREEPIPNTPDEYINLYKACWQDDPKSRPDIQYVEKMLIGMISGSNIVDNVDNKENDVQPTNEDSSSFSHPSTILTEPTSIDFWQEDFDNRVKEL